MPCLFGSCINIGQKLFYPIVYRTFRQELAPLSISIRNVQCSNPPTPNYRIINICILLFCRCLFSFKNHVSLTLPCCSCPQISKLSMIPVVCVMEWILHSKQYSREVKMAVVVVVLGVGVCTVTDVKVNVKGFICACVAVLSTSLQQIVSISLIYYSFLH